MFEGDRPPAIQPSGIFQGLRPGAILLGVAFDNLATFVLSPVVLAFFVPSGALDSEQGLSPEAIDALATSTPYLIASLAVGLACTAAGAWLGARRAGCFQVRHGAWIGVCAALVGLALYPAPQAGRPLPPLWFDLLGFSLLLPAGALGGLLARSLPRRPAG